MPAGTLEKRVGCAVAALLHFRVFLGAVYTIKAGCIELDRESGVDVMGMLSRRVCEAYVFDLCLIWFRGIMVRVAAPAVCREPHGTFVGTPPAVLTS